MEAYLGPEHTRLRDHVRAFALEHIAPIAGEIDRTQTFPWENVRAMGEMGLLGVPIPEEYGGMGRDYLSYILVVEELARHDASHAITVSAVSISGGLSSCRSRLYVRGRPFRTVRMAIRWPYTRPVFPRASSA